MGRLLGLIVLFLILAPAFCSAYSIENLKSDFFVFEKNLVVETKINFSENLTELEWPVPEDAEAISVYINENKVNFTKVNNKLNINVNIHDNFKISYITSEFIDNENFLINFIAPADIQELEFSLILPEGATLSKPIKEDTITTGSIYPKPTSTTTDGTSLIFVWQKSDVKKNDEFAIFASYRLQRNYAFVALILLALLVVAILSVISIYRMKQKVKEKIIREDLVEKHLKEDEEIIVNVLKRRENRACEQGTLRIITGFSKATLSRLLKELEDRRVIHKEKRGKKNIIFLKK